MNEEEAFLKAYEAYSDAIFRHCYFRVFDRETALDLVQETFMKTWDYVSRGKKIDNIRPFLYKVANNLIIDNSRKKREVSLDELSEAGFEPGHDEKPDWEKNLDVQEIKKHFNKLPEPYGLLLTLRYIDELMPSEIAKVLGESENSVSVGIHRGVKKFQEIYKI